MSLRSRSAAFSSATAGSSTTRQPKRCSGGAGRPRRGWCVLDYKGRHREVMGGRSWALRLVGSSSDSPLERSGFEPPVPRQIGNGFAARRAHRVGGIDVSKSAFLGIKRKVRIDANGRVAAYGDAATGDGWSNRGTFAGDAE